MPGAGSGPSNREGDWGRIIDESQRRNRPANLSVHLALLMTAVIWGGNMPSIKYMLGRLDPVDLMVIRIGGAAIIFGVLIAFVLPGPRLPDNWHDGIRLFLLGVLGIGLMNLALMNGQRMITAATASLIVTSNPIYTALISRAILKEPLTPRKIGGILLALVGFIVVLLFGSGHGTSFDATHVKGMLLTGIGPLSWAFYTVLSKPYLTRYPPTQVAGWTAIGGATVPLLLVPWDHGVVGRLADLEPFDWAVAFFLAAIGFVLAYILWYRGLQVLSASGTAVYIYLIPVFGLLFSWLFLGETITIWLLVGGAIILAGVILTNSGSRRPAPAVTEPAPAAAGTD